MATFMMFGRYSVDALHKISAQRTEAAKDTLTKYGGKVEAIYALLGSTDLVIIADFPAIEQAMQGSVALSKATGIAFSTSPAVKVDEFDNLMTGT